MSPRAVITGMGIASSAGVGLERFLRAVERGERGGRSLPHVVGPGALPGTGAAIPDEGAEARGPRDRVLRMAELAVGEALAHAGLSAGRLPPSSGLVAGTTLGGAIQGRRWHADVLAGRRPRRADLVQAPLHALADHLGDRFGLDGIRTVVSNACVSATLALGMALDLVRGGEAELVIAGGADSLHSFNYTGFAALGMVGAGPCLPFDRSGRGGMMLGEAAAFLVIESEDSARRRGTIIHAELAGHGATCDAYHPIRPRPDGTGLSRAIELALRDAAASPEEVDFIALHGVGLERVDAAEAAGLERIFGARRTELPVASLRPVTGHTLGSAGAVDAIACVLAIQRGLVPPTGAAGDGESALPPPVQLHRSPWPATIRVALKTSAGFGGMNAALVLRRWGSA